MHLEEGHAKNLCGVQKAIALPQQAHSRVLN